MAIKNEKETRDHLLKIAREHGYEEPIKKIFARYDEIFKGCKNKEERKAVAAACILELDKFFGAATGDSIYISGVKLK
jgi:hypothetical protein